jgi:hypothetical protein
LVLLILLTGAGALGCRVLTSALPGDDAAPAEIQADGPALALDLPAIVEADGGAPVEPEGISGRPLDVGCSDATREGFRDYARWPRIAGCAGGFDQPGVLGAAGPRPACGLMAGDTSGNPTGTGCSAADLCAAGWHVCLDATEVAEHSPTADCEGCVSAGEPRFFLAAIGASPMGICTHDRTAANDLHGCGGLGEPEAAECAPLSRRMGFADCAATQGVWSCGTSADSTREALVVTKTGPTMGGVLCCRN